MALKKNLVQDGLTLSGLCMPDCIIAMNYDFQCFCSCRTREPLPLLGTAFCGDQRPCMKKKWFLYFHEGSTLPQWRRASKPRGQDQSPPSCLTCQSPIHSANTYSLSSWPGTVQGRKGKWAPTSSCPGSCRRAALVVPSVELARTTVSHCSGRKATDRVKPGNSDPSAALPALGRDWGNLRGGVCKGRT